ncbi:MAG: DUF2333 family protein, partial [Pseudomonadota bacterium]
MFSRIRSYFLADRPLWMTIAGAAGVLLLIVWLILAWHWSRLPDVFWVESEVDGRKVVGYATVDSLVQVADTLLEKPGGYLYNDKTPPSVVLDNMPNWELGVLQQVRDLARVIRNDYSRSQSQSREDEDVSVAEPKFFFSENYWILPPTESRYREAVEGFAQYRDRLAGRSQPDAQFFARADNLREWLA